MLFNKVIYWKVDMGAFQQSNALGMGAFQQSTLLESGYDSDASPSSSLDEA